MEKSDNLPTPNARRRTLSMATSSIVQENGYDAADKVALETLVEMVQALIYEIGQSSRNYCELAGRTVPVIGDVVLALINMGISIQGLDAYAKRDNRHIIPAPQPVTQQKQLNLLQAGTKMNHPSHIPHYLPVMPDPHAYIRTPTYKQPVTEYEAIREKAANQKRDIERALTRFLAKTSDTHSLFDNEDNQMFPLIACKSAFPTYLAALNPTDQVFDFEELEYHYQVANRTEDVSPSKPESEDEDGDDVTKPKSEIKISEEKDVIEESIINIVPNVSEPTFGNANSASIDNPYLRAATVPKKFKAEHITAPPFDDLR